MKTSPPGVGRSLGLFLSAGEVSGDVAGGHLARKLIEIDPDVLLTGVGGSQMRAAGVSVFAETSTLGSVGVVEALSTAPGVLKIFRRIRSQLKKKKPDAAVLIGNDVFHFFLARWLRAQSIPTFSYFPPQVWIWRSLLRPIARSYDWILTSFPEEDEIYRAAGARTRYVGHYLRDVLNKVTDLEKIHARRKLALAQEGLVVGIFPGSRLHEVRAHTAVCLHAVRTMLSEDPSLSFLLPLAQENVRPIVQEQIQRAGLEAQVRLCDNGREALRSCDLVLACSGTVTLEAALMEIPMVIFYRVSPLTMVVIRLCGSAGLLRTETVGLPNLLAGERIVPELHQNDFAGASLAREALAILQNPSRYARIQHDLARLTCSLVPQESSTRTATTILEQLESRNQSPAPELRKTGTGPC